jgi:hypothetical protein
MSFTIVIRAEADRPELGGSAGFPRRTRGSEEELAGERLSRSELRDRLRAEQLPAHQFPAKAAEAAPEVDEAGEAERLLRLELEETRERERRAYRGRTIAMLRRYMRYSIETGRMPSLLGREIFRAKVTSYTVVTFEDRVIFVHDMEKCLERLDEFSRQLIARHVLQEHDLEATGRLLQCTERTVRTYIPIVLDVLSEILVEVGLLERVEWVRKNSCQGGENGPFSASDSEDGKYKV